MPDHRASEVNNMNVTRNSLLAFGMILAVVSFASVPASATPPRPVTVDKSVDQYGAHCAGVFVGPQADFSEPYVVVCAGKGITDPNQPIDCPAYVDADGISSCV